MLTCVMCPLTSPLQLELWPSQSYPHRSHNVPHANCWPVCQQRMHNTTSRSCFHAGSNRLFFFPFFPLSLCALLPTPDNPHTTLRALTPRIGSTHTVASLDEHRPPHPPPNHATTEPLPLPSLRHPYASLHTCTEATHMHNTHEACGG